MKFLIRRIRYAFAGHLMRGVMSIISLILVFGFVIILISGAINQKNMFKVIFGWMWNSSQDVANKIDEGDTPLEITDQGVYIKGQSPDGAKSIDVSKDSKSSDSTGDNAAADGNSSKDNKPAESKTDDSKADENKSDNKDSGGGGS